MRVSESSFGLFNKFACTGFSLIFNVGNINSNLKHFLAASYKQHETQLKSQRSNFNRYELLRLEVTIARKVLPRNVINS